MPRYKRHCPPKTLQHVISRFTNREYRFDVPGARAEYLSRLGRAIAKTDWISVSYALMSTHAHDGLLSGDAPPSDILHPLKTGFAGWLNSEEGRLGPVFAERYKNITCDEELAAKIIAYIHNNPVRAGVVGSAEESDWTSHRAYIGEHPGFDWLDVELGLSLSGFDSTGNGRAAFHDFVRSEADGGRDDMLSGNGLQFARKKARLALGAPAELGSPKASGEAPRLTCIIDNLDDLTPHPRIDVDVKDVIVLVAKSRGLQVKELTDRTKRRDIVSARQLAILLWSKALGQPQRPMVASLGLNSSTGCRNLQLAESCPVLREEAASLAKTLAAGKNDPSETAQGIIEVDDVSNVRNRLANAE